MKSHPHIFHNLFLMLCYLFLGANISKRIEQSEDKSRDKFLINLNNSNRQIEEIQKSFAYNQSFIINYFVVDATKVQKAVDDVYKKTLEIATHPFHVRDKNGKW
jgi:hypothetical protein